MDLLVYDQIKVFNSSLCFHRLCRGSNKKEKPQKSWYFLKRLVLNILIPLLIYLSSYRTLLTVVLQRDGRIYKVICFMEINASIIIYNLLQVFHEEHFNCVKVSTLVHQHSAVNYVIGSRVVHHHIAVNCVKVLIVVH